MSRDGKIDLKWADGEYTFRLGWGELEAIQESCNAGPWVVHGRLNAGAGFLIDVSNVIRLGLIGGGAELSEARALIEKHLLARPPHAAYALASSILDAAIVGDIEEQVGKSDKRKSKDDTRLDDLPNGKVRFAPILSAGAIMGFAPDQVRAMSVWSFMAAWEGYVKANSADQDNGLTNSEIDVLWEMVLERS